MRDIVKRMKDASGRRPVQLSKERIAGSSAVGGHQSRHFSELRHKLSTQTGYSSAAAGWSDEVVVELWSLPPGEWPEHVIAEHRMVVHVGSDAVSAAWNEDGRLREGVIPPGVAHVLPQGSMSRGWWSKWQNLASFNFSSSLFERLLEGRVRTASELLIERRNQPDRIAYDLARRIVNELVSPTEALYGDILCRSLGVHLLRSYGRTRVDALGFKGCLSQIESRRVLDYMLANLNGRLSVSALAKVAGLSDAYFARAFRATFGEPPHKLVLRWRLERAARLVRTKDVSLAEAAVAAGFCDQAHFTNAMRLHFGTTPANLLKQ
jgi:AraC family transcriptional regulator